MEKDRKIKMLSIIALVLAIAGMSLGFAAFSATLNISSSATVTPNSEDLAVEFSTTSDSPGDTMGIPIDIVGNATAEEDDVTVSKTSLSGLNVNFTEPGESVTYSIFAHNIGKYDAYLNSVTFKNVEGYETNKVCTKVDSNATDSLVNDACNSISISAVVDKKLTYSSSASNIDDHYIPKYVQDPEHDTITITITYDSAGARADGAFSVEFGDIVFEYGTVD